mgnify:CR=1 FL=1
MVESVWWDITTAIAAGVFIGKLGNEVIGLLLGVTFQYFHEKKVRAKMANMPEGFGTMPFPLSFEFPASYSPSPHTAVSGSVEPSDESKTGQYI